jgi:hypothetical protein
MTGSDNRIKQNIMDVPDNLALQQVRDIPCRYYEYIDVNRGTGKTIGFIAQEVKEVLPMAVGTLTEYIPNENRMLENISWIPTSDNKWNLVSDLTNVYNTTYKFYVVNNMSDMSNNKIIKEITGNSDNTFTFDVSYAHVFCFGKQIDDFHVLDKTKIFALHHSAIQELDRQLQSEKQRVQSHDVMIQDIQEQINRTTNDPRTQTNITDANTSSALDTLRLLKPKTFNYIDTINNTDQTVYGFDSNEVKQVLPYAADITKTQKIPNMYQKASVLGKKIIFTSFNVVNLVKDASNQYYPKIVVLDADDKEREVNIVSLTNSYTVETDSDLQSFIRTDSSVANCIFVYGQVVENYETLSKDYIWTISTAALQEVDKQVQEEKTQRQALETKVNQMETQLASLTTILTNAGLMNT